MMPVSLPTILPVTFAACLVLSSCSRSENEETGKVKWGRDVDAAITAAGESGKPVFLLFQEVPG